MKRSEVRKALERAYKREMEDLEREAAKRRRKREREWRIFWWSAALATCVAYWVWWLWPSVEPVRWAAFG